MVQGSLRKAAQTLVPGQKLVDEAGHLQPCRHSDTSTPHSKSRDQRLTKLGFERMNQTHSIDIDEQQVTVAVVTVDPNPLGQATLQVLAAIVVLR